MAKDILIWVTAALSLAAAALWLKASLEVPYKEKPPVDGWQDAALIRDDGGKLIDIVETAKQQAVWNKWAALCAGVAALCQGIALMLPSEQHP